VFTGAIGRWWPLAELGVFGAGSTVTFTGGKIVERSLDGQEAVWGTVTRWEPPVAVGFSWHPGRPPDRASHVEVTFTPSGTQTLVTLEHGGWDVFDDPAAARSEYGHGWPKVLDCFAEEADRPVDGETWVALVHRPGPSAPHDGSLFDDPRFADHVAFLSRMQAAGYLIAAGPFMDAPGEGMTILRLPGRDQMGEATRLATQDDASVAGGFFTVSVRPWSVMLAMLPN